MTVVADVSPMVRELLEQDAQEAITLAICRCQRAQMSEAVLRKLLEAKREAQREAARRGGQ